MYQISIIVDVFLKIFIIKVFWKIKLNRVMEITTTKKKHDPQRGDFPRVIWVRTDNSRISIQVFSLYITLVLWNEVRTWISSPFLKSESESPSVLSDSLWHYGLYSSWNSLSQNTGVGSLLLLQWILPTQGSNPGLPLCRQILYRLSCKESPRILEWVAYPFSSGSSPPRNRTLGLLHCRQILYQLSYQGSPPVLS